MNMKLIIFVFTFCYGLCSANIMKIESSNEEEAWSRFFSKFSSSYINKIEILDGRINHQLLTSSDVYVKNVKRIKSTYYFTYFPLNKLNFIKIIDISCKQNLNKINVCIKDSTILKSNLNRRELHIVHLNIIIDGVKQSSISLTFPSRPTMSVISRALKVKLLRSLHEFNEVRKFSMIK